MYKPVNEVILYVRALVLARFVIVIVVCGWSAVVPASDKLQFCPSSGHQDQEDSGSKTWGTVTDLELN